MEFPRLYAIVTILTARKWCGDLIFIFLAAGFIIRCQRVSLTIMSEVAVLTSLLRTVTLDKQSEQTVSAYRSQ